MMKTLVIGDCHVEAHQSLARFLLLQDVLDRHKPDNIILMGDFLTLEALSAWDRDKRKSMEGRRYWTEIEQGNRALNIIDGCIHNTYKKSKRSKKRVYRPKKVFIMGNHEDRLRRYFDIHPTFDEGNISIRDNLDLDDRGYEVVEYGDSYRVGNTHFTHIPIGRNDRPVSGTNILNRALELYTGSVVFGHTHYRLFKATKEIDSDYVRMAYNCGCYFTHEESYKLNANNYPKWVGVSILTHINDTEFDIESINIHRMQSC